jgi:hypothetical protein
MFFRRSNKTVEKPVVYEPRDPERFAALLEDIIDFDHLEAAVEGEDRTRLERFKYGVLLLICGTLEDKATYDVELRRTGERLYSGNQYHYLLMECTYKNDKGTILQFKSFADCVPAALDPKRLSASIIVDGFKYPSQPNDYDPDDIHVRDYARGAYARVVADLVRKAPRLLSAFSTTPIIDRAQDLDALL